MTQFEGETEDAINYYIFDVSHAYNGAISPPLSWFFIPFLMPVLSLLFQTQLRVVEAMNMFEFQMSRISMIDCLKRKYFC